MHRRNVGVNCRWHVRVRHWRSGRHNFTAYLLQEFSAQARLCQQLCPQSGTQGREQQYRCAPCQLPQLIRGCSCKMLGAMVHKTRNVGFKQLFHCPFVPRDAIIQLRIQRGALVLGVTSGRLTHWPDGGVAAGRESGHQKCACVTQGASHASQRWSRA